MMGDEAGERGGAPKGAVRRQICPSATGSLWQVFGRQGAMSTVYLKKNALDADWRITWQQGKGGCGGADVRR